MAKIVVLRLGHRKKRDARLTTHVGLVARAFGADGMLLSGEIDDKPLESLKRVVERWGGRFTARYEKSWRAAIKNWRGDVIHLTMYGEPLHTALPRIKKSKKDKLIVVGGEKVPGEIYGLADWNVAVGNQPHSEAAALAVFLDRFFGGAELKTKKFTGASIKIVPTGRGKKISSF